MFCGNCGAQNEDNAVFCAGCGANLKADAPAENAAPVENAAAGADKNKKVGIIAVAGVAAVAVIALIVLIASLAGGKGYEKTAVKYYKAVFDADAEAVFDLVPKKVINYMKEEMDIDNDDYKEMIEEATEELEDAFETLEDRYGKKPKIEIEVEDADDFDEDDLEDLQDAYEDMDVKVSDAKYVDVEVSVKGEDGKERNDFTLTVIKVGGSWYIETSSLYAPTSILYYF